LMEIRVSKIKHIKYSYKKKIGLKKYKIVGDEVEPIDYEIGGIDMLEKKLALRIKKIQRMLIRRGKR
ncbi:MAG: hypothetical protein ACTSWR_03975, partial [Candidatus Helarchaeota archaeon]